MPSDNLENKIKEAAEQYSPEYSERSWLAMKQLLDEHLPEKKKDRRRFFFILLFLGLLVGGGLIITFTNNGDKETLSSSNATNEIPVATPGNTGDESPANKDAGNNHVPEPGQQSATVLNPDVSEPGKVTDQSTKPLVETIQETPAPEKTQVITQVRLPVKSKTGKEKTQQPDRVVQNNMQVPTQGDPLIPPPLNKEPEIKKSDEPGKSDLPKEVQYLPATNKPENENITTKTEPEKTSDKPPVTEQKKPGQRIKKGFLSNLNFSVSAGPDVSLVNLDKIGKAQFSYGAGIGYTFSSRLNLRGGFYVARKIYTADPDDYNPPKDFWNWYPNLKKIDANCKVYEIPLILDYSFGKKRNWSASAGVSSILMKEEEYEYTYRPPAYPQDVTYTRVHTNENNHYFSMIHLSSGYSYKIGKSVMLKVEPYIKIPVSGIGYGKIKLNSGGIMVTGAIYPFK